MINAALPYLRCPVCADQLAGPQAGTLRCGRGHAFDLARQGYASLTAGRTPHSGDTTEMIEARATFLAAGHYSFIADALTRAATQTNATGLIVDAGVGTGYYLARVLDALAAAAGLGLDVSKPALRRAARAHPRAAAALVDVWGTLPVADASADLILNVFAPRNGAQFHRILRPDGVLLVVTPAANHLRELIAGHGLLHVDPDKADRVSATLGEHFRAEAATIHERRLRLTAAEAHTLIAMTPSARHLAAGSLPTEDLKVPTEDLKVPTEDLKVPTEDLEVTAAVDVTVYRRR
jgi:23S rRNA (guanine745-N1)-methyltransferase